MPKKERPLSDITVIELGHIVSGPYCSLLLADLGATVIKIEHPDHGDAFREASPEASSTFNYLNRNKEGVTLDLKNEAGREVFDDLVADADVLIENYSPGTTKRLDIDYETLSDHNPELIYCSIKGFNDGPYEDRPALDPVAEALSGLMSTTGYPNTPPARCGTSVADMAASLQGAIGVLGALRQRDVSGEGQHLTSPMFEATVGLMGGEITYSDTFGEPSQPWEGGGQNQWAPYGVFQCSDGKYVFIGPSSEKHWEILCESFGFTNLLEDERFQTLPDRREHREALDEALEDRFMQYTREEVINTLQDVRVPSAPVNDTLEVSDDPHLNETGGFVEVEPAQGDDRGTARVPASPLRSTGFSRPEPTDPPKQGEDTETILSSLGYSEERITELKESGVI